MPSNVLQKAETIQVTIAKINSKFDSCNSGWKDVQRDSVEDLRGMTI